MMHFFLNMRIFVCLWWSTLRQTRVVGLTESHIDEQVRNYGADHYSDVEKFIAILKCTIEKSPVTSLTQEFLISALEHAGLYSLPICLPESRRMQSRNVQYILLGVVTTVVTRHYIFFGEKRYWRD